MYRFLATVLRISLTLLSVIFLIIIVEIAAFGISGMESFQEMLDLSLDLFREYLETTLILVILFQLFRKNIRTGKRLTTYLLHASLLTIIACAEISLELIGSFEKGSNISFSQVINAFLENAEIVLTLVLAGFLIPLVDHFFSKQTVEPNLKGPSGKKGERNLIVTILKSLFRNCLKLFFGGIALLMIYGLSIVSIYLFLGLFDFENLPVYAVYIIIILFLYLALLIISLTIRILVRTFPLRANGHWRRAVVVFSIMLIGAVILCFSYLLAHPLTLVPASSEMSPFLVNLLFIFFITYFGITIILPFSWLLIIHARCKMRNGILYLRKFNGKGDIAIMAAIIRKTPARTPVTFIASPGWNAGTWDPIVLIFAGFRWHMPWKNIPLFLKTSDSTWQKDVKNWIASSRAIVIDISDLSESVKMETTFIDEKNARHKTIALTNEKSRRSQLGNITDTFKTTPYALSWSSALPRIFLGFLFILILAMAITSLIETSAKVLDIKVLIPVFIILLPMLLLFVRPSLSKSSENSIKTGLNQILHKSVGQ